MAVLSIRLFGAPEITLNGRPVETDRRKAVALLAYLAVTGAAASRDSLAALLWPDFDTSRAYAYLRRTLWELGQGLGEGWILAEREQLRLNPQADAWVDVCHFQGLLKGKRADAAARLAEAAALYRGDFMAGFSLRDSPDFEAWQVGQAESLRRQLSEALSNLSRACAAGGETDAAVAHARRWLALDNLNEEAQRWLMELYTLTGQRSAALRQAEACARLLQDELGVQPEAATLSLVERIRRGELRPVSPPAEARAPEAVADRPVPQPLAQPGGGTVSGAPRPGTPFVGREAELAEIARLLGDPDCRLLTLLGPGGIGKTRLALQTATALGPAFSSGACFVPLAAVAEPELVVPAVAAALQLKFKQHTNEIDPQMPPAVQLLDYLRQKELLLVLDNFEHLIPAAGIVSDVLAAAPGVKVLATSRERLNLGEEWALAVQGMAYPTDDLSKMEDYSATRLFLQVARQVQVGFIPTEADLRAIGRVCRLVDGMPLGIELAATWVRLLSCPEIAAEIERSLDFLSSDRRGLPERHHNLRAVFEHSWALLSESERAAFRKLSLFHGGFTRAAAAQVAGASLGLLSALVDKSLVRRGPDGRYDLHEVLKRYAAEKLDEVGQLRAEAAEAYHHYYLAMLQDLAEDLKGPRQLEALQRQQVEGDNLRAGWRLTVELGDLAELYQGLLAIFVIYEFGLRHREAAELVEQALQRLRQAPPEEQANSLYLPCLAFSLALLSAYYARGFEQHNLMRACYDEAMSLLERLPAGLMRARVLLATAFGARILNEEQVDRNYRQCLETFQAAGEPWDVVAVMIAFTDVHEVEQGRVDESRQLMLQALELSRGAGNRWGMALSYHFLALAAFWTADYEQGLRYGLEARAIYLEFKDRWRAMEVQVQLGRIETDRGRYAEARIYFLDNLQFAGEMGARYFVALNQDCLGYLEQLDGNLEQAGVYYRRSLEIYRQMNLAYGEGMSLGNLGDVAMRQGDTTGARQYFQASLQAFEGLRALNIPLDSWGVSVTYKKLGSLALQTGDYAGAEQALEHALAISRDIQRAADIQEVLTLQAQLFSKTGRIPQARALLEEVLSSPATIPPVRAQAETLLAAINS